jgi:hypothetical protein
MFWASLSHISSQWKSHHRTRHRWTKPLISVGHRHQAYIGNHMKTKQINIPPTTHSNQFQHFHDSSRQQYGTYINHYSTEIIAFSAEYTLLNNCNFNLVYRYSFISKCNSIYYSVTFTRCCSYSCFVLLKMGDGDVRNMYSSCQIK